MTTRDHVRFRVLGQLEVQRNGRPIYVPSGQLAQLLGLLLVHSGKVVKIEMIHDVLWDGEAPRSFRKVVQVRMSQLRRLFEATPVSAAVPARIVGSRDGYRMEIPECSLDLHDFRELVARAAAEPPVTAEPLLRRALSLWRGRALTELSTTTGGMHIAVALEEERLAAVATHADLALATDQHAELVETLPAVLAEYPLRERLRAQLMYALHRIGRQADALTVFDAGRRLLAEELGLDPGKELRDAQAAILSGAHDSSAPQSSESAARAGPASGARGGRIVTARRTIPLQLPADLLGFAGRVGNLEQLDSILDTAEPEHTAVVIIALSGMAGVGKTTLAVHWSHRVAYRFPNGQLYVNLRGFDPTDSAVSASDALRGFLESQGVPSHRIPATLDARAALYRSMLAGRRVLVVLDNARDPEQVRPLLPGAPGCVVVVTSRHQLSGLVALDGAHQVVVDLLTVAESRELLCRRLDPRQVAAESRAVDEIVSRCARLPLALAVVSARATARDQFSLPALAEQLRTAKAPLDPLDLGDPTADVRAVFSWSYHALADDAARLFRLLGLHPGPDIGVSAAASLAGMQAERARALLRELINANLIEEHLPGRFALHDLLRSYAAELAYAHDSAADRNAALRQLLDFYLHAAHNAERLLRPHRESVAPPHRHPAAISVTFSGVEQALEWVTTEHAVLLDCIEQAATHGFDTHAWQLARASSQYFGRSGRWRESADAQSVAFAAATRAGDRTGQAHALLGLGRAEILLGRYDPARAHLQRAQSLFRELADWFGQARATMNLARASERRGELHDAIDEAQRSLQAYRTVNHRIGESAALNNIGWLHARIGDFGSAKRYCEQALILLQKIGDRMGQGNALDSLGYVYHRLGNHEEAIGHFRRALEIFSEFGIRDCEAATLHNLGDAYEAMGGVADASRVRRRALKILTDLDHLEGGNVRARILGLHIDAQRLSPEKVS